MVPPPGLDDLLPFVSGWLRDPVAVGLPFTSSFSTARRLARTALQSIVGNGPVLELGGGTGAVTAALLELGCERRKVVVVERDEGLCATLRRRLPGVQVIQGNALQLADIAARHLIGSRSIGAVISGLPMRAIPRDAAVRCYRDAFGLMPPGGVLLQYTYGRRPPVNPTASMDCLKAELVGREWRNFPPVSIWAYRQESPRL